MTLLREHIPLALFSLLVLGAVLGLIVKTLKEWNRD